MSAFPETLLPLQPYEWTDTHATALSRYPSGVTYVRPLRLRSLYTASLTFPLASPSDYETLLAFIHDCRGAYTKFTFVDFQGIDLTPKGIYWGDLYVGVGDGTTTIFDLPAVNAVDTNDFSIYSAGVLVDPGDYTAADGTGADGRDRVTFDVAPANGNLITISGTFRRAMYARMGDVVRARNPEVDLIQLTLDIEEVV